MQKPSLWYLCIHTEHTANKWKETGQVMQTDTVNNYSKCTHIKNNNNLSKCGTSNIFQKLLPEHNIKKINMKRREWNNDNNNNNQNKQQHKNLNENHCKE